MGYDWPITSLKWAWWPIILIVYFKTVLGREYSRKVKKKFIVICKFFVCWIFGGICPPSSEWKMDVCQNAACVLSAWTQEGLNWKQRSTRVWKDFFRISHKFHVFRVVIGRITRGVWLFIYLEYTHVHTYLTTSPIFEEIKYRINCFVLSYIDLPSSTAATIVEKLSSANTISDIKLRLNKCLLHQY